MTYIRIGVLTKTRGLKGEVKVKTFSDAVDERFVKGNKVYRFDGKVYHELVIKQVKDMKLSKVQANSDPIFVVFENYEHINLIEPFLKQELFIQQDHEENISDDEIYYHQLMNCDVYEKDERLGSVSEIVEMGTGVVMRVKTTGEDLLIPFHKQFVKKIHHEDNRIDVELIEGMR